LDEFPVAVIGAGVVGACCAYYLARAGIDVLIVDGDRPGRSTTSASFSWVNASAKVDRPEYFDLNFAGLREHERLAAELSPAPWWNPTGHIRWDYGDDEQLTNAVETMASRGYPAEIWDVAHVRRVAPEVAFADTTSLVAAFPTEGWVDGAGIARALVDAAARTGAATAFGSPVREITTSDGAVAELTLGNGDTHEVARIVNAAGPAAAGVAALIGRSLPMQDSPGLVVRVETRIDCVRHVVHAPGLAIRPDGSGRALLQARALEREIGTRSTDGLAADVCRLAAGVVPALAGAAIADARVGRRPIPGDGLPAIGRAGEIDGYYEAVTHSGITLGPLIGRALATEIVHGEIDPLVSSYGAGRFA
jgi:glycine/D-amino acid oxidase-like deaminating enzyme